MTSAADLEKAALEYVLRYPGSVARVRAMLVRRIERDGADPALAGEVIERLVRLGALDDARIAASRVHTLRGRGRSDAAIRAALAQLGIEAEIAERALASEGDELSAAKVFVRRKKLGDDRERDLARLGRAGFSYEIAVRALDGEA